MTIRLLSTYDGFAPQSILTLDPAIESALIADGNASATLTGGTVAYRERFPLMVQPAVQKHGTVNLIANRKAIVPLSEGTLLTITPAAGTTGTYQRYDSTGAAVGTLTAIGAVPLTVGAFEGDGTVEIKCTTGSMSAKVRDANVGAVQAAGATLKIAGAGSAVPRAIRRRAGFAAVRTTTSTAAGGMFFGTTVGTLTVTEIDCPLSKSGKGLRLTPSDVSQSSGVTIFFRAKVQDDLNPKSGTMMLPVRVPLAMPAGCTIDMRQSADVPASDPPNVTPTNRRNFVYQPNQIKKGQWQNLTYNAKGAAGVSTNSPDQLTPQNPTDTGTFGALDAYNVRQIMVAIAIPQNGTYVDVGDISFDAGSIPVICVMFDGGGSDLSHIQYAAPYLEARGKRASFSVQSQIYDSYRSTMDRLYAAGHDFTVEGSGHKDYTAFPNDLIPDYVAARDALIGMGMARGAEIFTAPFNSINPVGSASPGVTELLAAGAKWIRATNRWNIPPGFWGREDPPFGAFNCDVKTAAQMQVWVEELKLHGDSGDFLFHSLVTGTATGNQTNLTEWQTFIDYLAAEDAAGRIVFVSKSEAVEIYRGT